MGEYFHSISEGSRIDTPFLPSGSRDRGNTGDRRGYSGVRNELVDRMFVGPDIGTKLHADRVTRSSTVEKRPSQEIHWKVLSPDVRMSDEVPAEHPNAIYLYGGGRVKGRDSGRYIHIGLESARRNGLPENFRLGNEISIAVARREFKWSGEFEAYVRMRGEKYLKQGKNREEAFKIAEKESIASYKNPVIEDRARGILARVRLARDLEARRERISIDVALRKYAVAMAEAKTSIYSKGAPWEAVLARVKEYRDSGGVKNAASERAREGVKKLRTEAPVSSSIKQRPVEQRPVSQRPVVQRPVEQRPVSQRPVVQSPVEQRPISQRPVEPRPVRQEFIEQRPVSQRPVVPRPTELRPVEQGFIRQNSVEQRPVNRQAVPKTRF